MGTPGEVSTRTLSRDRVHALSRLRDPTRVLPPVLTRVLIPVNPLDPERLPVADLSSFSRAKDWAIGLLIALVFSLLGMVASENRQRIEKVEARDETFDRRLSTVENRDARQDEQITALQRHCIIERDRN